MATYVDLAANLPAIEKMAKWIGLSGMFGRLNDEQACIIASECFLSGQTLLDFQRRNDVLGNNISIPYDAMLASFISQGGKIKIIERSAEAAIIELTIDGETRKFSLSWDDAAKEPFVYQAGKGGAEADVVALIAKGTPPPLKAKYATPRSRTTMLYARCVSDAIRAIRPNVNFGCYTPEEIEDFTTIEGSVVQPPKNIEKAKKAASESQPKETSQQLAPTPEAAASAPAPVVTQNINDPLTDDLKKEILGLMKEIKQSQPDIVERVQAKLKASGLDKLNDLTVSEGEALLRVLQIKNIEAWVDSILVGHKATQNPS